MADSLPTRTSRVKMKVIAAVFTPAVVVGGLAAAVVHNWDYITTSHSRSACLADTVFVPSRPVDAMTTVANTDQGVKHTGTIGLGVKYHDDGSADVAVAVHDFARDGRTPTATLTIGSQAVATIGSQAVATVDSQTVALPVRDGGYTCFSDTFRVPNGAVDTVSFRAVTPPQGDGPESSAGLMLTRSTTYVHPTAHNLLASMNKAARR